MLRRRYNPITDRRIERASPTLAEFVERYLAGRAFAAKWPTTQAGDRTLLEAYVLPRLGAVRLSQITPAKVAELHRDLCDPAKAEALAASAERTKRNRRARARRVAWSGCCGASSPGRSTSG